MSLVSVPTKKGGLNFQDIETGAYIHSQYDPIKEIERSFAGISSSGDNLVCFGLGAGYILEFISQKKIHSHLKSIYIWEPEPFLLDSGEVKKKFNHSLSSFEKQGNL